MGIVSEPWGRGKDFPGVCTRTASREGGWRRGGEGPRHLPRGGDGAGGPQSAGPPQMAGRGDDWGVADRRRTHEVSKGGTGRAPGRKTAATRSRPPRHTGHRVMSTPVRRSMSAATGSAEAGGSGGTAARSARHRNSGDTILILNSGDAILILQFALCLNKGGHERAPGVVTREHGRYGYKTSSKFRGHHTHLEIRALLEPRLPCWKLLAELSLCRHNDSLALKGPSRSRLERRIQYGVPGIPERRIQYGVPGIPTSRRPDSAASLTTLAEIPGTPYSSCNLRSA